MGTINPRTSRVGIVLGLTNEDIRANSQNADTLFNFLKQKMEAFRTAGIESQKTWAGLWSNIKDIGLQIGGMAFSPLFDKIKEDILQDAALFRKEMLNLKRFIEETEEKMKTVRKRFLKGEISLSVFTGFCKAYKVTKLAKKEVERLEQEAKRLYRESSMVMESAKGFDGMGEAEEK